MDDPKRPDQATVFNESRDVASFCPPDSWGIDAGTEKSPRRLGACMFVYGRLHHLTAIRVKKDEDGNQVAYNREDESDIEALYSLDPNDPYATVEIPGFPGEWLIFLIPGKD